MSQHASDNQTSVSGVLLINLGTPDSPKVGDVRRYLRVSGEEIAWDFVRSAYASICRLTIIPLQDLMNLGSEARFNTPGRASGNWTWRYRSVQLDKLRRESLAYLRELAELYDR